MSFVPDDQLWEVLFIKQLLVFGSEGLRAAKQDVSLVQVVVEVVLKPSDNLEWLLPSILDGRTGNHPVVQAFMPLEDHTGWRNDNYAGELGEGVNDGSSLSGLHGSCCSSMNNTTYRLELLNNHV